MIATEASVRAIANYIASRMPQDFLQRAIDEVENDLLISAITSSDRSDREMVLEYLSTTKLHRDVHGEVRVSSELIREKLYLRRDAMRAIRKELLAAGVIKVPRYH